MDEISFEDDFKFYLDAPRSAGFCRVDEISFEDDFEYNECAIPWDAETTSK